jgi:hypothetical protein
MAHVLRFDEGWRLDSGMRFDQLVPDHTSATKGKNNMATNVYFIPKNRAERRAWLLNLLNNIETWGPGMGYSPAEILGIKTNCTAQIELIDAVIAAEAALQAAQEAETNGAAINIVALQEIIARGKTAPGYTSEAGAALKLISSSTPFDPLTFKPKIKSIRISGGEVRLDFALLGAHGVHVYCSVNDGPMAKIATDSSAPYIDGRPNATPGVAEVRKYMLRGCDKDDKEHGLDSDIVSITVAGH